MLTLRTGKYTRQLAELDPAENYHEMVRIMAEHEFPLDTLIAGELAQLKTFGIPGIARLLHQTGRYEKESTKRLDDTKAILREIMQPGPDSPAGREMVGHLNQIHGFYKIPNHEFLYTLSLFIFETVRWNAVFGWRAMTVNEKEALYREFRDLGEAMNIQDIPPSYEAFEQWKTAYEQAHQTYTPEAEKVTVGILGGLAALLPVWIRPLTQTLVATLINDEQLLKVLGLKAPPLWQQRSILGLMKTRAWLGRHFNLWEKRSFADSRIINHYIHYPNGYQRMRLGPKVLVGRIYARKPLEQTD
ncbi:oxygenase MpaB family protein [Kistimonas scapharcae]|uniref:Oxygenase MpaB family protein n=1 Tax=Kistimonas scapharcae TaxID=1036133 RepID=A0ABP8UXS3_9GAMM